MWVTKLRLGIALFGASACGSPQPPPAEPLPAVHSQPSARTPSAPSLPPPVAPAPPASAAPSPTEPRAAELPNFLQPVASVVLSVVTGNPRLLVGDRQVYEWSESGFVAKPRLLAEAFSQYDSESQTGFPAGLQGAYPDNLYVQVMRARAGEPSYRRSFLKWSKDRWQKLPGPLADSSGPVTILEPAQGTLAVGCVSERCFFQPVQGKPLVPRFSRQAGCATRMAAILDAELDAAGTLHVLGNECNTGRVLLESWPKGSAKSHVQVLVAVTPRPEGYEPVDIGLGIFDNEVWVWGVEWFWGGGPETQLLLTRRAGAAWALEQPPCDTLTVSDFAIWRGYQLAACDRLVMRAPGEAWTRTDVEVGGFVFINGQLLISRGDGMYQFTPPGVEPGPKLAFNLPCAGQYIDLGIKKDFAAAKKFVEPLGDLRNEMVLAAAWDQDKIFLVAPDEPTAAAAANRLGLQSEPECLTDQFQTFTTAD